MTKTVEFYFDLGSPATYLAYTQLPKICADTHSELSYIPMLLGGVFKATGNASPAMIPAKGRYMFQDLDRYAKRYGVPLKFNLHFPINTLMLMRGVVGAQFEGLFEPYFRAAFHHMWVEPKKMDDPQVFRDQHVDADARRHRHTTSAAGAFSGVYRLSVQGTVGGGTPSR